MTSIRIANVVFDAPAPDGDLTTDGELLGVRRCSRADFHREAGWPADDDSEKRLSSSTDPLNP